MRVEPIRKQRRVGFPAGVRVSNAVAHNEPGGHVRLIQTLDKPTRLLNRYGFVLDTSVSSFASSFSLGAPWHDNLDRARRPSPAHSLMRWPSSTLHLSPSSTYSNLQLCRRLRPLAVHGSQKPVRAFPSRHSRMRAIRSTPMIAGPPFDENTPMPGDCSKCGKRLTTNAGRTELDWEGSPDPVFMFLCLILLGLLTSARARGSQKNSDASSGGLLSQLFADHSCEVTSPSLARSVAFPRT